MATHCMVRCNGTVFFWFFISKRTQEALATTDSISQSKKKLLSELFGYTLWNDIKNYREYYNIEDIIQGMRACARGDVPPRDLQAKETIQLTAELQRELYEKSSSKNLERAENFLSELAKKPSVHVIENKKLYYEVLCEASDEAKRVSDEMAIFHYTISTLDGEEVLNTWKENEPKKVSLPDTIHGFSKGVAGMKEGEKRKIYIHPDFAYRKTGWLVPPQSLLIFDVQLIAVPSS